MLLKLIGLIIGALILGAGIYYLVKEKADPESRKINTIISIIGGVLTVVCAPLFYRNQERSILSFASSLPLARENMARRSGTVSFFFSSPDTSTTT